MFYAPGVTDADIGGKPFSLYPVTGSSLAVQPRITGAIIYATPARAGFE